MNKKMLIAVLTIAVVASLPASALADEENTAATGTTLIPGMKILTGLAMGSASHNNGGGTKMAWGVNAGLRFAPNWEAGFAYRRSNLKSESLDRDDSISLDTDLNAYLFEGTYRHPLGKGAFTAGLQAGIAEIETSLDLGLIALTSEEKVSKFVMGPQIGYQYPITDRVELGAKADYTIVFTDEKIRSFGFLATAAYSF